MPDIDLAQGLALYLILVISIGVHEFAHAWSADKLGDDVPRLQGRVTLNPLAHIDPIGTVAIPLFMILLNPGFAILGWGKPVMVNTRNFKNNPRDHLLSVAAGPISNLVIMLVVAILGGILLPLIPEPGPLAGLITQAIIVNAVLAAFNMIPIPPLDGSHFLRYLIGMSEERFVQLSQYGWIILILLINLPPFQFALSVAIRIVATPFLLLLDVIASFFV